MKRFSRRDILALSSQTFFLSLIAGCGNVNSTPIPTVSTRATPTPNIVNPAPTSVSTRMPTVQTPSPVDLDAKIGQMLMLGFRGLDLKPEDAIVADIRERNLGAVVLFQYDGALKSFTRNIQSPAQLNVLNASLQAYAQTPLLIGIDQEGGLISRLTEENGFPPTQSQKFYGVKNDPILTRAAAKAEGQVLKNAGINLNLAPVVDLDLNPRNPIIGKYERSFSDDPKIVAAHALTAIQGYHAQGILTTLKHFPGHGSSSSDSHHGFVDVTQTWQDIEIEPYRNLITAGLADTIMTAHIFNANLDPKYPATLSQNIITGILREQLKYDGVVISDDMQMGAIRNDYGFEQAVELALNAGVDMLAIANNLVYDPDIGARAVSIIKQLVQAGKISKQRIEESYQRIMQLKTRLNH